VTIPDDVIIEYNQVESIEAIEKDYLPSQILITTDDLNNLNIDVLWTLIEGEFDVDTDDSQMLVFEGEFINLPDGVSNLDDLSVAINVFIEGNPNVLVEPFGQIHVQATIEAGVNYSYTVEEIDVGKYVNLSIDVLPDYNYLGVIYYESEYLITDELEHSQFLTNTSNWHVVILVEEIYRPSLETSFASGDGSQVSPLVITSVEELNNMRYFLDKAYYFELSNDITFAEGEYFLGMESPKLSTPFNGVFDGKGYTIYNYKASVLESEEERLSAFIDINEGVIKNLNLINVNVINEHDVINDAIFVSVNKGLIENVNLTGYKMGRGGGLVGINVGIIKNVDVSLDMVNSNGAIAKTNHNQIMSSTVDVTILINQKGLGYIGGVVGANMADEDLNTSAVIHQVDAVVHIQYEIEDSHTSDDTYIGGFAYLNKGDLTNVNQALIIESSINILIESLIEYRLGQIGGFVTINSNLGAINHSDSIGEIYGSFELGGFVAINQSGNYPGTISYSTADVDIYGTSNTVGGFVAINRGDTVSSIYKGQIIDSEAYGDVTGTSYVGNFYGKSSGGIDSDSIGYGEVILIVE
jgi:hypothetical protein